MIKLFAVALTCFASTALAAQDCASGFLGTKTLYTPRQRDYSSPPAGYVPIFINHAGRHGARHLTKEIRSSIAYALLEKADSTNALMPEGRRLKAMIQLLDRIEKNEYRSISMEGKMELENIAARMYENNRPVFITLPEIKVTITKEIRTKQSAEAFLNKWKENGIGFDGPMPVNDTVLRFYDLSPAYDVFKEKGNWQVFMKRLKEREYYAATIKNIISRFFNTSFTGQIGEEAAEEFVTDIFGFLTITYSLQQEIQKAGIAAADINFTVFFTCEELQKLSIVDEAEDFYLKGPGTTRGIQVNIAAPLLMDFINTTDQYINSGKNNIQLRFTHAEAIAPFATLMGINEAWHTVKDGRHIRRSWKAGEIVPLSANIQWILYGKANSDDYLVKFLLNEKEVAIEGISGKMFPYYSWKEVRRFYLNRLSKLGLVAGMSPYSYLIGTR